MGFVNTALNNYVKSAFALDKTKPAQLDIIASTTRHISILSLSKIHLNVIHVILAFVRNKLLGVPTQVSFCFNVRLAKLVIRSKLTLLNQFFLELKNSLSATKSPLLGG